MKDKYVKMIINVLTWFLVVCVANGYCRCGESNRDDRKIFSIYRNHNTTIGQNTRLRITKGNCSELIASSNLLNQPCFESCADKITTGSKTIHAELIKLSSCYGFYQSNWDTFLDVIFKYPLKSFMILLTYMSDLEETPVCLEVNFNKSPKQTEDFFTLVFNRIETIQMAIKGIEGDKVYRQKLTIWREEMLNREGNEWRRFVYADTTTNKDMHTIHIAEVKDDTPKIYNLLQKNMNNQTEIIWDTYDTGEIVHTVPNSDESWYIVQESPRTYHNEIVASALGIFFFILFALIAVLWYASKAKQKSLVLIYCQCDRHNVYAAAMQKLQSLLEKHCMFKFETPSVVYPRPTNAEDEILLNGSSKAVQFIVFIPFPNLVDHDRSYESEAHQLCEKYSRAGKKIELNLHFESNKFGVIRSEWPKGSYKSFQLLENLPSFIRHVHPFYFPSFLERFIRPKLWGPRIKRILERNTFTNDHLREITDPKFHVQIKTEPNSFQADPNLALNAFI